MNVSRQARPRGRPGANPPKSRRQLSGRDDGAEQGKRLQRERSVFPPWTPRSRECISAGQGYISHDATIGRKVRFETPKEYNGGEIGANSKIEEVI